MKCAICAKREAEEPQTCSACRWLMGLRLREIPDLAEQLAASVALHADDDPRDPVASVLPVGPIPGKRSGPRVSGSRESGVPSRFDLLAWLRPAARALFARGVLGIDDDQVGTLSVATVLNTIAGEWIKEPWCRVTYLPEPDVWSLSAWLGLWMEEACDEYENIADNADEFHEIHLALRRANGLTEPKPELAVGVPCKSCGQRTIYKTPGYYECDPEQKGGGCQALLTEAEFKAWSALNAGHLCGHKYIDDDRSWWCALAKGHDGDCEPYREEEAA